MTPYQRLDKRIKELERQNRFLAKFVMITPLILLLMLIVSYAH